VIVPDIEAVVHSLVVGDFDFDGDVEVGLVLCWCGCLADNSPFSQEPG